MGNWRKCQRAKGGEGKKSNPPSSRKIRARALIVAAETRKDVLIIVQRVVSTVMAAAFRPKDSF